MIKKEFVPFEVMRNNAFKLAYQMTEDKFIPDIIYVALRGGALMGNVISEYFKAFCKDKKIFFAAVVARSYSSIGMPQDIVVDGWTYDPKLLKKDTKVLIVDDIFDTGRTINFMANEIFRHGMPLDQVRIAVHDYKDITFKEKLPVQPHYFCRYHKIESQDQDIWINYLSHEFIGFSREEIQRYYIQTDHEMKKVFRFLE